MFRKVDKKNKGNRGASQTKRGGLRKKSPTRFSNVRGWILPDWAVLDKGLLKLLERHGFKEHETFEAQ
jgi:hypothetical protein